MIYVLFTVSTSECSPALATAIPEASYAMFQMMFAVITPLLITGAIAERMRFKIVVVFCILWEMLIYYPVAHWIWAPDGWLNNLHVLDFAGGIVIHATSGARSVRELQYQRRPNRSRHLWCSVILYGH